MPTPDTPRCDGCRGYAHRSGSGENAVGDCRRYAPRPFWSKFQPVEENDPANPPEENLFLNHWPTVFASDWCGEHEPVVPFESGNL